MYPQKLPHLKHISPGSTQRPKSKSKRKTGGYTKKNF